jgi:hypothetical protein
MLMANIKADTGPRALLQSSHKGPNEADKATSYRDADARRLPVIAFVRAIGQTR